MHETHVNERSLNMHYSIHVFTMRLAFALKHLYVAPFLVYDWRISFKADKTNYMQHTHDIVKSQEDAWFRRKDDN